MATNEQIHNDLKDLTAKLTETNELLVQVVSDNKHRDQRIDSNDSAISAMNDRMNAFEQQRVLDREEYKPVWDKAREEQTNRAGYIRNGMWIVIVLLALIITNSLSSGVVKLPFQGDNHAQKEK